MWLPIALLGHLMNAFVFITDKAFVEKLFPSPKALAFISGASGAFTFAVAPWFLTGARADVVAAGIAAGAVTVPALVYFFTALSRDEVSRVVPTVGSITPLFTFLLSYVVLNERLDDQFLIAFGFLAAGGILIAFRSFQALFERKHYGVFFIEIFVAFLFASGFVFQKYAFEGTDDFSAFLWSRVGAVAAALPLLASAEVREKLRFIEFRGKGGAKKGVLYTLSRIFAGVSPLVITVAISFGSAALVNALQGVQYAFLFILAVFFSRRWPAIFKEELARGAILQKIAATILIMTGLAFLV